MINNLILKYLDNHYFKEKPDDIKLQNEAEKISDGRRGTDVFENPRF